MGIDKCLCRKEKTQVFQDESLESDERFLDAFSLLGEQQDVNETVGEHLEEFTCKIYGKKTSVSINEARYYMF